MNPAEMIVAIVALIVIGGVLRARFTHGAPPRADAETPLADDNRRLAQEVQQLKERVQVLERVITDNRSSVDLASEIDRLRDR